MEVGVTKPVLGDAVERRSRNDTAEGRWCAETDVVGEDEQDVGRAFRRDHARWPSRFGLISIQIDLSLKLLRGRRKVAAIDRRRGIRRSNCASSLLGLRVQRRQG